MSFCRTKEFMQEFSLISKCQREIQKLNIFNLLNILYEKLYFVFNYIHNSVPFSLFQIYFIEEVNNDRKETVFTHSFLNWYVADVCKTVIHLKHFKHQILNWSQAYESLIKIKKEKI